MAYPSISAARHMSAKVSVTGALYFILNFDGDFPLFSILHPPLFIYHYLSTNVLEYVLLQLTVTDAIITVFFVGHVVEIRINASHDTVMSDKKVYLVIL